MSGVLLSADTSLNYAREDNSEQEELLKVGTATAFLQEDPSISFRFVDDEGKSIHSIDLAENPELVVSIDKRSHFGQFHRDGIHQKLTEALRCKDKQQIESIVLERVDRVIRRLPEGHKLGVEGVQLETSWLTIPDGLEKDVSVNIPIDFTILELDDECMELFIPVVRQALEKCRMNNVKLNLHLNPFDSENIRNKYTISRVRHCANQLENLIVTELTEEEKQGFKVIPIEPKGRAYYENYIYQAAELGANSVRFSIDMAQVLINEESEIDTRILDWILDLTKEAQLYGINVDLCLGHMNFPEWIPKGWAEERMSDEFLRYIDIVLDYIIDKKTEYGLDLSKIDLLLLNETITYVSAAHFLLAGDDSWAPNTKHQFGFPKIVKEC
ncbi:MAG: family 1 glycosylhydrolase [Candidatus Dojkabacteria bacterium]|nr:family 1 glycosylhydrolase [Candidatus Dojkabacteria bacterium]MDQ7021549.1 family 1 glycosylhydrolase [Candidatus Dojkabacteria bacterium]